MAIDISKFKTCKVLVFGDLIIDEFIDGTVESISREAPIPVVNVSDEHHALGGAGNVAHNLSELGARVSAIGLTGAGSSAKLLMKTLDDAGIDGTGVCADPLRTTARKTRITAAGQQMLQIDRESPRPMSSANESALIRSLREILPRMDIVIVSDRGKGTLTRPMMTEIVSLSRKQNKIIIVDPWGSNFERYTGATLLTPNVREVSRETGVPVNDKASLFKAGTELLRKTRAEGLIVTCGKDGLVLFGRTTPPFAIPSQARQVFDVTGARDTMVAVLALSLATGGSFKDAATVANVAAGIAVGKLGTARVSEKEIILELMAFSGSGSPAGKRPFDGRKNLY
jgi:D-beta-D-heptose 7-phosphate kinase/D-beta-D-heptose 1-phosphate adenosyltransferase